MALIHTIVQIPSTFEEIAVGMISYISKGYDRVDFVADCYFSCSEKNAEKRGRGESDSRNNLIKSFHLKVPTRNFASFLSNGENKTRMIQSIFESIVKHKPKILNLFRTAVLILCREDECHKVTLSTCEAFQELLCNQEKAENTKIITHEVHALQQQTITEAFIKSNSGDTEIIICLSDS